MQNDMPVCYGDSIALFARREEGDLPLATLPMNLDKPVIDLTNPAWARYRTFVVRIDPAQESYLDGRIFEVHLADGTTQFFPYQSSVPLRKYFSEGGLASMGTLVIHQYGRRRPIVEI